MKPSIRSSRRTKIVCTIGPATESRESLESLVTAGMDVARLNFSHGSPAWHRERVELLRQISQEHGRPIGILQDLPGLKLRVGEIASPDGEPVELRTGSTFRIHMGDRVGNALEASVDYLELASQVRPGDRIVLGDGDAELEVRHSDPELITCEVIAGGPLSSRKGLTLPMSPLDFPGLTDEDRAALEIGLEIGVDFIALSFVRSREDIRAARDAILACGGSVPLIAKIERPEAVEQLEAILEESDGLLVARGDLAVAMPLEMIPQVQKRIIRLANAAGKPVITATQMLRSMVSAQRPTRAETTDVANALYDGTDAVMLSEETAVGSYPVATVRIMHRICVATERDMMQNAAPHTLPPERRQSVPDSVAAAACLVARHLNADALLIPTRTGSTAIKIASFRPTQRILAISTHSISVGRLTLTWGVLPLQGHEVPTHEAMLAEAERTAMDAGLLEEDDLVVITAGFPVGGPGSTNTVTVKQIGERIVDGTASWLEETIGEPRLFTGPSD